MRTSERRDSLRGSSIAPQPPLALSLATPRSGSWHPWSCLPSSPEPLICKLKGLFCFWMGGSIISTHHSPHPQHACALHPFPAKQKHTMRPQTHIQPINTQNTRARAHTPRLAAFETKFLKGVLLNGVDSKTTSACPSASCATKCRSCLLHAAVP